MIVFKFYLMLCCFTNVYKYKKINCPNNNDELDENNIT